MDRNNSVVTTGWEAVGEWVEVEEGICGINGDRKIK